MCLAYVCIKFKFDIHNIIPDYTLYIKPSLMTDDIYEDTSVVDADCILIWNLKLFPCMLEKQ